jgi:hypothetical protein
MVTARGSSASVTLADGRVLILGGVDASGIDNAVDIYDPWPNDWSAKSTFYPSASYTITGGVSGDFFASAICQTAGTTGPCMTDSLLYPTATLLNTGKVLITGGLSPVNGVVNTIQIFDPGSDQFTQSACTLNTARTGHSAVLLENGKVLIFGGSDGNGVQLTSTEVIDPNVTCTTNSAAAYQKATDLHLARAQAASTLLPNGKVLTQGGYNSTESPMALSAGELFTAYEGYSTAPAAETVSNVTIGGVTVGVQDTNTITPASGNALVTIGWASAAGSDGPEDTIDSGQGTESILYTPESTGVHVFDVLTTDRYGLSYLITQSSKSVVPPCQPITAAHWDGIWVVDGPDTYEFDAWPVITAGSAATSVTWQKTNLTQDATQSTAFPFEATFTVTNDESDATLGVTLFNSCTPDGYVVAPTGAYVN